MPRATVLVPLLLVLACGGDDPTTVADGPVATTMTLSTSNATLTFLGETLQIVATVLDQDGSVLPAAAVTWSSSDVAVATVVGGLVTAVSNGPVEVTATSGAANEAATVTVAQAASSITSSVAVADFTSVGETLQLSATVFDSGGSAIPGAAVTWVSLDEAIVTVSATGLLTAVAAGSTTVSATSGSAAADVTVTVTVPAATSEIVFTSFRDGDYEVYVMDSDGSNQVNLTNASGSADWSGMAEPGGGRVVVFVTDRNGNAEIYSLDRDAPSDAPVNLTNDARGETDPAWAWDASRIAFARDDVIWLMDPDGGNQVSLGVTGRHPTWSPDGMRIAYIQPSSPSSPTAQTIAGSLFVMDADGSNVTNIAQGPGQDRTPEWSPDGTKIAFNTRLGASGGTLVYTVEPDGSDLVFVEGTGALSVGWPTWSPDGTRIAYSGPTGSEYDIWVMDSDGTDNIRITTATGLEWLPKWIR